MAFVYVAPGVRISEVPRAASVALGTVPLSLCVIGIADKKKQVNNEPVIRGQILEETLTVAGSSPHIATLAHPSNQEITQAILNRDGVPLSNQSFVFDSASQITVDDLFFSAGAVYTFSYVATDTLSDDLLNINVDSVQRVGSLVGLSDFLSGPDFVLTGDALVWQAFVAATFTGITETFDLSTLDTVKIAFDGKAPLEIVLSGAVPTAVTAAEVVTDINTAFGASTLYGGPAGPYATVAADVTGDVVLTSPNTPATAEGESTSIEFFAPSTSDATALIFGPVGTFVKGAGKRPQIGETYYATYKFDRPDAEYNVPIQVFSTEDGFAVAGNPSLNNQVAIGLELGFLNNAPTVFIVIIKDADDDDVYTDNDYIVGIQGTEGFPGLTELVVLTPRLQVQLYLKESVTAQSSPDVGNRRRGWFGMDRGTAIGNSITPDTFVYRAAVTLQVPGDSPGRGRFILAAPSDVSRTIRLADGTDVRVQLDGTYLALAQAAVQTSFTSVSQTLLRRTLSGFNVDDFQTYLDQEAKILGSAGCSTIRLVGGNPTIVDPITTEGGGARDVNYMEISARTQADLVATFLESRLDAALIGAVPNSLSGFTITLKGFIGVLLNSLISASEIGPYENPNGTTRPIDYTTDIIVTLVPGNRTSFRFKFFFQAKFPVKRLSGEFSVGGPVPSAS